VTHLFAFHHVYAFFMQPLRLLKRLPLTLFLRADTLENYVYKRQHPAIIRFDKVLEGFALAGVRLYGVSETLTQRVVARHTVLHPVSADTVRNDIPRVHRHASPPPSLPLRLACVGVLEVRKNQALAIQCMSYIPNHLAHLYVFGSGPGESQLRKLVNDFDVQDKVTFMGWVNGEENIWSNVDLLLFPSRHEGIPNAILEALAWGVPILASDIPEHREILPQSCLLPVDDVTAWRKALQRLIVICPKSLMQMRQIQHHAALKLCFDWDREICQSILAHV
jgi:glycosyltransferase involved in cell wall biosynthesis